MLRAIFYLAKVCSSLLIQANEQMELPMDDVTQLLPARRRSVMRLEQEKDVIGKTGSLKKSMSLKSELIASGAPGDEDQVVGPV
jgi:hypothetical protein